MSPPPSSGVLRVGQHGRPVGGAAVRERDRIVVRGSGFGAEVQRRMRAICFAFLTPFYFLRAGSLIEAKALVAGIGLIAAFLAVKMAAKFVGILPLTQFFAFGKRNGMYTTMMMSTGLTFGSISALFGLTNHIIDQTQYTILVTAVIGSAVVPTLIAQLWFQPHFEPLKEDA